MRMLRRALAMGVVVALVGGFAAASATAVTITPATLIILGSTRLQTFNIPSIGATYTCLWNLMLRHLVTEIPLDAQLHRTGGVTTGNVTCNEPGVSIAMLVGELEAAPGPWTIGFRPVGNVLALPTPTGALLTVLGVKIRVTAGLFTCLFTGSIGLLFKNNTETVVLLGGTFTATPTLGDTCMSGLAATKGAGVLAGSVLEIA